MKFFSSNIRDAIGITGLILVISVLHYSTDVSFDYFHDLYKILYYIPIILAAFRFGAGGGIVAAIAISVIYTPHVLEDWTGHPRIMINRFVEMVIFVAVATITGKLVENERRERRRYETVASELQETLERLQQQSLQLTEVEEQLRVAERLATLGELTASLAHEVRNPLAAIKGTVEILRDDYPQNGKNHEFFDLLINDVERINKVISNYMGQVVSARSEGELFDLVVAARTVAQILQAKARKERKHLHADLPEKQIEVRGDEIKFRQIILNLLMNAFAATESGGNVHLQIDESGNDGPDACIMIVIRDDGSGIPENVRARIFKPFYTTRADGTGLGLPIAKRIAEEYGWRLEIDSEVGRGTVARVILPIAEETK